MRGIRWIVAGVLLVGVIVALVTVIIPATQRVRTLSPSRTSTMTYTNSICPSTIQASEDNYSKALDLTDQGKIEDAKAAYLLAIAADPTNCDAMDNLGVILRGQGQLDEAISWYTKSLAVKPDDATAEQDLGLALAMAGRTDESITAYQEMIRLAPENPEGYYGIGQVYNQTKRPSEAVPMFVKAEGLYKKAQSPLFDDAQVGLGESYYLLQDCGNAITVLEAAYQGVPDTQEIDLDLGMCYASPAFSNPALARNYLTRAKALGATIPDDVARSLGP